MEHAGAGIPSRDVALRVDPTTDGLDGVGEIDLGELAPAQQKSMGHLVGTRVGSHNVATRVDRKGVGLDGALEIDRAESSSCGPELILVLESPMDFVVRA